MKTHVFVGPSGENVWSQTRSFECGDGSGVVLVRVNSQESSELLDLAQIGIGLLDFTCLELTGLAKIELNDLTETIKRAVEGIGAGVDVCIGVCLISEGTIMRAALVGELGLMLWRDRHDFMLISNDNQKKAVVGKLKEDDQVVFGDNKFVSLVREKLRGGQDCGLVVADVRDENLGKGVVGICLGEGKEVKKHEGRDIYVGYAKRSRLFSWVGLGVLLIVIVASVLGFVRRGILEKEKESALVSEMIEEAKKQAEIVVGTDPEKAKQILDQVVLQIDQKIGKSSHKENEILEQRIKEIEMFESFLLKAMDVELRSWIEFELFGLANQHSLVHDEKELMYLWGDNKLVAISIKDRSQIEWTVEGGEGMIDFVLFNKKIYALKKDGIYEGSVGGERVSFKKVTESDEAWEEPRMIRQYGGGLYVLDGITGELSKYSTQEVGVSSRKRWFGKGIVLDLSKIVDLLVDGDVWLLSSSGKLEKWGRGVPVEFGWMPIEKGGQAVAFGAVASNESEVMLLDNVVGRVLVFDRVGKYLRQYVNSELVGASDLLVVGSKGFVLFDRMIKEFSL